MKLERKCKNVIIKCSTTVEVKNYDRKKTDTMLLRLADRLLLLKCYDRKMVKLPGCSSIGASPCS